MSSEISIARRGLFGQKVARYERWDEMPQRDFSAFCAVLMRPYFSDEGREAMAEFLDEVQESPVIVMKRLKVGRKTYHGPLSKFRFVRFGELIAADSSLDAYAATGNEDFLYKFVASLYRPKGRLEGEDVREEYNDALTDKYAREIRRKSDKDDVVAIMVNYSAVMRWITSRYPLLFPRGSGEDARHGEKGRSYLKMARALASGKTDADMQEVYRSYVSNVFDALNDQIRQDRKR